jgi:type VI protein secretion system component Hcp
VPKRFNLKMLMAVLIAAVFALPWQGSASAAASGLPSILLTLDGIQGSYSAPPFKDAIVISAYSSVVTDSGKPKYGDIQLTKAVDNATLPILKALAKGQTIREGTLYFQNNNPNNNLTYMEIHLTNIVLTGQSLSFEGSEPKETVSLHAEQLLYKYTTQKPDGSAGTTDTLQVGQKQATSVMTQYHFEPIYNTDSKGTSYIEGFTVTLKAMATNSSVGQTQYRINGGSWVTYTGPFEIYAADTHSLEYFSTNNAGDTEKANIMNFDTGTFSGAGSF